MPTNLRPNCPHLRCLSRRARSAVSLYTGLGAKPVVDHNVTTAKLGIGNQFVWICWSQEVVDEFL